MSERQRFPLCWPEGWKRTAPSERKNAKFYKSQRTEFGSRPSGNIDIAAAVRRLSDEFRRLGVDLDDALVSSNVKPTLAGIPSGNVAIPADPGVAVYWQRSGKSECMAIDIYDRVADNIAAVAATLESLRTIERHGGGAILERAFRGFMALPEQAGGKRWQDVLGFANGDVVTEAKIKQHFRDRAPGAHPDTGGNRDLIEELIWARDAALREVRQ
jgi:hypothetical protein